MLTPPKQRTVDLSFIIVFVSVFLGGVMCSLWPVVIGGAASWGLLQASVHFKGL